MRALITGGAGFIGSHLTQRMLNDGHEVICIDDLSTGSVDNISAVRNHPSYEFHCDSIFNVRLLAELIDLADVVFHLAAAVGVKRIVDFPVQTIETNVRGSELVLSLAAKKNKPLLITSTSEVYGKSTRFPFNERDDVVLGSTYNSRWSYACSKMIDEFLALAYWRERKLPVRVVRLFNTVGPRQTGQYGMVLPTFARQALLNEDLTVYGTGEQSRCFAHVADVVDGLLAIIDKDKTAGEIFNLGNTEEISMNDLAKRVIAATGSRSVIRHIPYSEAYGPGFEDMTRRLPDISKAREWVGFSPKHGLDSIIESVVVYMKGELQRKGAIPKTTNQTV
jgi:UDP-glucose 4-epimerase